MTDIFHLVRQYAGTSPSAVAILAPGRAPLTYAGLLREIEGVVARMNTLGVGTHDRVAVVLPDGPELAVAVLAIGAGATCAPLNPAYRAREFDSALADLAATALVVPAGSDSPAVAAAVRRGIAVFELTVSPDAAAGVFELAGTTRRPATGGIGAGPNDTLLLLHTSGTTSRPKQVPLTHCNVFASASSICAVLELTSDDRCLNVMPLFHIHGLSTIFSSLAAGASVVCAPAFSAQEFFAWLQEFQPTWYTAAPAVHQMVLAEARLHPDIAAHSTLRFIRSASSAMPTQLIAHMERAFGVPFIEAYGMTEASPQVASNRLPPQVRKRGSVGKAAGPEVAIMDGSGNLLPPGESGEVVIRGTNVMSRYANEDGGHDTAFTNGWFRTGDQGRLDQDGDLFITGRLKEIVNRGGEKISLQEVDDILREHPAIAEALSFAVPHPTLGECVAAAVVLRSGAQATVLEIQRFAASRLAPFKLPQPIVTLDAIPTGHTGKHQRRDLAAHLGLGQSVRATQGRRALEPPRTPTEAKIGEILASVLVLDRIGIDDNFFQMGGHSLTAAMAAARIADAFEVELAPQVLFERPTVRALAEDLATRPSAQRPRAIPARSTDEPRPLSFAQQRLWFLDQMELGNPAYNMQLALQLTGALDVPALEDCLNEIRRRHESLRTTFTAVSGEPRQVVMPTAPLRLALIDVSRFPASERCSEARRVVAEQASEPFSLARGPLFRAVLVRLGLAEHMLVLTMHHIVCDGWSKSVLASELGALYTAFVTHRASPLEELPIQYADYAEWQRQWLAHAHDAKPQLDWWKEQLHDAPHDLQLSFDRRRPVVQTYRGASHECLIPRPLVEALRSIAAESGATLFMASLAAFQALLWRYSGQEDFTVGTPIASRTHAATEKLIGFFANTLVMRADLSGDPTFRTVLDRVRSRTLGAFANQDVPFERLVDELQPTRHPDRTPLFQVMFAFQSYGEPCAEFPPGLAVEAVKVEGETAKFDLTLYLSPTERGLEAVWQYNRDLFDPDTIHRLAGHFHTLICGVVAGPDVRISRLPLVTDAERSQLLVTARGPAAPTVHARSFAELFEARVEQTSTAIAVQFGDEQVSYRDLNERANRLAHRLRGLGVTSDEVVAVCLPRSADMPVALLGVLKAGGACLPLDPDHPADRLAFMLENARAMAVVTDERSRSRLATRGIPVVCVETLRSADARETDRNPEILGRAASLAYEIYTSGSTGEPKGVMITHANVCHYVRAMQAALGVTERDRYLHTASFTFSSSMRQFLLPLACGATVVMASSDEIRDPLLLFQAIQRHDVSIIDLVPSYWRIATSMLAHLDADSRAMLLDNRLRLILSASETLHSDLPGQWAGEFQHGARVVNMFGQTETTGIVTVHPISPVDDRPATTVPIGRPIAGTRTYVLDAAGELAPTGVPGELYIGGPGVGRGYMNQDATAERFVPDPFDDTPGARLYRTGDRARMRPDGILEFIGRADQQVKVRGFRIEPGEIEAALNSHPDVLQCVVAAQQDGLGEMRLIAYVATRSAGSSEADPAFRASLGKALRESLKGKLPAYMLPASVVVLSALPRTPSGKVDRKALPSSTGVLLEAEDARVAAVRPAAEILARIWAEVLRRDRIGIEDNFFDLGGDSLLGLQMIDRANRAGLRLTPLQLFQYQTVAELARVAASPGSAAGPPEAVRVDQSAALQAPAHAAATATDLNAAVMRITLDSARAFGREALEKAGLSATDAAAMTEVQIEASLRGQPTHNIGAIPRYARRLAAGATNPRPRLQVERETSTSALIDADNGPGQLVAVMATELAIRKAQASGIGVVGVRNSNHFGAAGHYVWLAARRSIIGLCTTNSALWLSPTGSVTPLFGTNPIGVGIPASRHAPIVLDVSMSVTAKGKVALHLAEGRPLPPGWIMDRFGRLSTDAADLAAGLGVPIGGHKGYGLALVMEVLAGVLTGAGFGEDHRRERMRQPGEKADFGHFFLAINPEVFMPMKEFTARVDRLIDQVKAATPAANAGEILVPGESEMRARECSLREGVPILPAHYRALQDYKTAAQLNTDLEVIPESLLFTRADIEQTIPARFEQVVGRFGAKIALTGGDRRWTYRELNRSANRIAHAIRERASRGAGAVACLIEQSPEMVIATLAILKAGKAYLAIHPRMPFTAQAEVTNDIGPDLLLTTAALRTRAMELAAGACDVLVIDELDERYPDTDPPVTSKPHDASTIFYTSGTTGQSKGVVKSHRAVLHRVWLSTQYDAITPADRQSLLTHCSFSASESDMFCALLLGASVHLFDISAWGFDVFRKWLDDQRVTLLHPPVLYFRRFLSKLENEAVFPSVRLVALAGDTVLPADLHAWRQHFSATSVLLHRFAISETALLTVARIDSGTVLDQDVVDTGFPVPDKELALVNESGEPVAHGEVGELVVRSAYLADGYWRRPAETVAAFKSLDAVSGQRAYHTGDLGRFRDDGRFLFLGRKDHQVKIRGYRVDAREVEAVMLQLDGVAEAAVVARREQGETQLVAYVVLKAQARWEPVALRARLRALLPEWKIPAHLERIASLPTTATGKVDRQRLTNQALS